MPFPWTLQRYIFREMGKTFLLAVVALTGVLGLGGGVRLVLQLGEVTPGQLVRLIALALPLAATLALPVAALFSAAATYGRLAGDNEFVACRSGGINLHVLFLPGLALSVASAAITFGLINFVIPGMTKSLNDFTTGDIGVFIQQRLREPKGFTLRKYRMTADASSVERGENERVALRRVAFVEVDRGEWVRYGTADALFAEFDRTPQGLRLSGWLGGVTVFDREKGRFVELAQQTLAADELRPLFGLQIKFLALGELLYYWRRPQEWQEAVDAAGKARDRLLRHSLYARLWHDWADDRQIVLSDTTARYAIRAASATRSPRDGSIELVDAAVEEHQSDRDRTYQAARAVLEFERGGSSSHGGIKIEAYDVTGKSGEATVRRTKEALGPVAAPAELVDEIQDLSIDELLAREAAMSGDGGEQSGRRDLGETLGKTSRTIAATLHERMAYSLSVLVLVVLAAALGIILRGAHLVAAFGISFLPALAVMIAILAGKQLAQNAGTHGAGLLTLWAGILAVAVLDWWTLTRLLRR